jgi:hypothetical protein
MLIAQHLNVNKAYQFSLRVDREATRALRQMASTDPRQEQAPTQLFQKPLLLTDPGRNTVMGDQRGKAKLTGDGPQYYKCKGFRHFVVRSVSRERNIFGICV